MKEATARSTSLHCPCLEREEAGLYKTKAAEFVILHGWLRPSIQLKDS